MNPPPNEDELRHIISIMMDCYLNPTCSVSKTTDIMESFSKTNIKDWTTHGEELIDEKFDLEYRNNSWMNTIKKQLRKEKTLIAVGLDHLVKKHNLIELLTAEGYTMTPIISNNID